MMEESKLTIAQNRQSGAPVSAAELTGFYFKNLV